MPTILADPIAPQQGEQLVFERRAGRTVLWAIIAVVGVAWCAAPLAGGVGWVLAVLFGLPCLGVTLLLTPGIVRSWRQRWWILRIRPDALILRLRSCLNSDLPSDEPHVVRIENTEIDHACAWRFRRRAGRGDDEVDETLQWLELKLARPLPPEVREVFESAAERRAKGRSHFEAMPCSLAAPDRVLVHWASPTMGLAPRLKRQVEVLRRAGYTIEREVQVADAAPAGCTRLSMARRLEERRRESA